MGRCKQQAHCIDVWWCKASAQCKKAAVERTRPTIQLAREIAACPGIDYSSHAAALERLARFEKWLADRTGPMLHIDEVRAAIASLET